MQKKNTNTKADSVTKREEEIYSRRDFEEKTVKLFASLFSEESGRKNARRGGKAGKC